MRRKDCKSRFLKKVKYLEGNLGRGGGVLMAILGYRLRKFVESFENIFFSKHVYWLLFA